MIESEKEKAAKGAQIRKDCAKEQPWPIQDCPQWYAAPNLPKTAQLPSP